jgi:hypothetical protein
MKTSKISKAINEMTQDELIQLNNEYCQQINASDDEVYSNDEEFFEVFFADKVLDAVPAVSYGDYSYSHDYVKFNGYGNLESFSYFGTDNLCELPEVLAEYIHENFSEFEHLF